MANNLRVYDFSGGLNQISEILQDNETPSCKNVVFDRLGAIKKRKGYRKVINEEITGGPINGIHTYSTKDGVRYMIATSQDKIYLVNKALKSTESIKEGLEPNGRFSFTNYRNKAYMTNGYDRVQVYDGSSVEELEDAPLGAYITDIHNRLFIAGNREHPTRLYYSELNLPDQWEHEGLDNFIEVGNDSDLITGFINLRDNLVIFKEKSIWLLFGDNPRNFSLKKVQDVGTTSTNSIVNIQNNILFLNQKGVYTFDGANIKIISTKIDDEISKIGSLDSVYGAWYNQHYLISYPKGGRNYNSSILTYDLIHNSWTYFEGINAECFTHRDNKLFFGDSNKGLVYEYGEGYSDDGEDIAMEYNTKHFNFSSPEVVKTFRKLLVESLISEPLTIEFNVDRGNKLQTIEFALKELDEERLWGANWSELIWSNYSTTQSGKSLRLVGRSVKMKIKEKSNKSAKIIGFALDSRAKRRRFY